MAPQDPGQVGPQTSSSERHPTPRDQALLRPRMSLLELLGPAVPEGGFPPSEYSCMSLKLAGVCFFPAHNLEI